MKGENALNRILIQKIEIQNFESIDFFQSEFHKDINILSGERAFSVLKALGVIFGYTEHFSKADFLLLKKETFLKCDVKLSEDSYRITAVPGENRNQFEYTVTKNGEESDYDSFLEEVSLIPEVKDLSFYRHLPGERLYERLKTYRERPFYYTKEEFSKRTKGVGLNSSFQPLLGKYIREFKEKEYVDKKLYRFCFQKDGQAISVSLDEKEIGKDPRNEDFDYLCLLSILGFWKQMEEKRRNHPFYSPLFLKDGKTALGYVRETMALDKQVFISGISAPVNLHRSNLVSVIHI